MLVSAISSNNGQTLNTFNQCDNELKDTTFRNLSSEKQNIQIEQLYKEITMWKLFCHKQILNQKLDILA